MKNHVSVVITLALVVLAAAASSPAEQSSTKPLSCTAPEYRQFDFWAGDWDVFDADAATKVAHVRVDRILDGCVLREEYEDTNGLKGQSLSSYDASKKLWQQTWVTNRGQR